MKNSVPEKFLFMKVGSHAGEDFETIMRRKSEEFRKAGRIFWGYGGTACHPLQQVQPFVRSTMQRGGRVHILMETINSKADPDLLPASEYSEDGINWREIPNGVRVTGSRYAVVLGEIKAEDLEIPLGEFAVGIGNSEGRVADDYLQGRIDKACLSRVEKTMKSDARVAKISWAAELLPPYAVLLRS